MDDLEIIMKFYDTITDRQTFKCFAQSTLKRIESRYEVNEDELPEDMSEELYHAWFLFSYLKDGVRMGPRVPEVRT